MTLFVTFLVWWAHGFPAIHKGNGYFIWGCFGVFDILTGWNYQLNKINRQLKKFDAKSR